MAILTCFVDRELGSVLTTFHRQTAWMDSPEVARHIATSSFDPMMLRAGRVTVYLCLPHDRLETLASLQRMWVGTILRRITRGVPDESQPVMFFLDEAAHLGRLPAIEQAVTLMRGMGIRLWFFYQSLSQVRDCYGEKAPTILENIGTQQFFSVNSLPTAEEIAKRIGDATVANRSGQTGTSDSHPTGGGKDGAQAGSRSTSSSTTTNELARQLLKQEEVLVLPPDTTLIFHNSMRVTFGRLMRYYDAPEFKNGRCGRQRGLGIAASLLAAFSLAAGVAFAGVASVLATIPLSHPTGLRPPVRVQSRQAPYRAAYPGYPVRSAVRRSRSASNNLPSRSGYLIPIQ